MDTRQFAEEELKKDKDKTDDQILADVYEELLMVRKIPDNVTNQEIYLDLENIKHGLKRLSGFLYNQSRASAKLVKIGILISILTLLFTLTSIFPVEYLYKNFTDPILFAFVGVLFFLLASFLGIVKGVIAFKTSKTLFGMSMLLFVGSLFLGISIFFTFTQ
ncbi:hypothetical protein KC799_11085 [candidate division KSB1 bacterium]|nr:hypothetical protein [candidate division KSB1 bacterium]